MPPALERAAIRTVRVTGGAAVALFVLVAFTPLTAAVDRWLAVRGELEPAQAIVVLGGSGLRGDGQLTVTSLRRTWHGVSLFRAGLAPLLVFSGPRSPQGVEALVRSAAARDWGVPAAAILTESTGRTTREEGVHIARLLQPRGIRRILLVVDAEGMWRARRVFERVGFAVVPSPASDVSSIAGDPEARLELARRQGMELVARVYYALAGFL